MQEPRRLGPSRQRDVNFVRDLCSDFVISKGRDEADNSARNLGHNRRQIGTAQRRQSASRYSPRLSCSTIPWSRIS